MRQFLYGIAVLLLLAGGFVFMPFATAAEAVAGDVKINFSRKTWDFGVVAGGGKSVYRYRFVNSGKKRVKVTAAVADCACITTIISPAGGVIPAGGEGQIQATLDSAKLSKGGTFHISIYLSGFRKPVEYLALSAIARNLKGKTEVSADSPKIVVEPAEVNLGTITVGETAFYKVIIGNKGKSDLYIYNFGVRDDAGMELAKTPIKNGKKVEITGFYIAEKKGGFRDKLIIRSNDPEHNVFAVPLLGVAR